MGLYIIVKCFFLINWFYLICVYRCVIINGLNKYLLYIFIFSECVSLDVSKELLIL